MGWRNIYKQCTWGKGLIPKIYKARLLQLNNKTQADDEKIGRKRACETAEVGTRKDASRC